MKEIKFPDEKRCYDCGNYCGITIGGVLIGDTQDLPIRCICVNCIIKMYKMMFGST